MASTAAPVQPVLTYPHIRGVVGCTLVGDVSRNKANYNGKSNQVYNVFTLKLHLVSKMASLTAFTGRALAVKTPVARRASASSKRSSVTVRAATALPSDVRVTPFY